MIGARFLNDLLDSIYRYELNLKSRVKNDFTDEDE